MENCTAGSDAVRQFENLEDIDYVLQGLLDMGFDDVYEVSRARNWFRHIPGVI